MTGRLTGTVALVTGASSGIGEATAVALAAEGATVAIAARRRDRLELVVERIGSEAEVLVIETDVTDQAAASAMVEDTVREFGRLDIVINNAGVMLLGPIVDAPIEEWRRMVELNLLGLLYTTHATLPHLLRAADTDPRRVADLVNVSSVAGRHARLNSGVYNATKFGVGAFSESLRQEVTRNHVRVSLIEPGAVSTELITHNRPEVIEGLRATLGPIETMRAEDIAESIVFTVTRPRHVAVNEVLIRPTEQERCVPTDAYSASPHFLADLGVDTEVTSDTTARATLPVTRHITGGDGGVRAAVLATLVDMAGGFLGVRVLQPDWMATADLTIQVVRPASGPVVEARASVLRRGRTTLVIEANLYNVPRAGADLPAGAGEELVAWSTVTFAVLPASTSTPTLEVPMDVPNRWSLTGAGFEVPIAEALRISVVDPAAGRVSMPKHRYLLNSLDAVQGGAMALVGEVAAAEALAAAGVSDVSRMVVTDLRVSYLTLGRVGPIVTRTRVLGAEPGAAGLSAVVELVDAGVGDRVTTVIMVGAVALDPVAAA